MTPFKLYNETKSFLLSCNEKTLSITVKPGASNFMSNIEILRTAPAGRKFNAITKAWEIVLCLDNLLYLQKIEELKATLQELIDYLIPPLSIENTEIIPFKSVTIPLPHQLQAVSFLLQYPYGYFVLGGMGTCKTAIMAYVILNAFMDKKILIVAKNPVKTNVWPIQLKEHAGIDTFFISRNGVSKEKRANDIMTHRHYAINYESVGPDLDALKRMQYDVIIADESQAIKNIKGVYASAFNELCENVERVYCLTGTPRSRGHEDLFNQCKAINPYVFGTNSYHFMRKWFTKRGGFELERKVIDEKIGFGKPDYQHGAFLLKVADAPLSDEKFNNNVEPSPERIFDNQVLCGIDEDGNKQYWFTKKTKLISGNVSETETDKPSIIIKPGKYIIGTEKDIKYKQKKINTGKFVLKDLDAFTKRLKMISFHFPENIVKLPPLTKIKKYIEMPARLRKVYDATKRNMIEEMQKLGISQFRIAIQRDTKLMQLASGAVYDENKQVSFRDNFKSLAIVDIVENDMEEGQKAVIWFHYLHTLKMAEKTFRENGIKFISVYRGVENLKEMLEKFKTDDNQLLLTTQILGEGQTLNMTTLQIHHDHNCQWMQKAQAIKRNHRQGQPFPVICIDLIAENSIDEISIMVLDAREGESREILERLTIKDIK